MSAYSRSVFVASVQFADSATHSVQNVSRGEKHGSLLPWKEDELAAIARGFRYASP